MRPGPASYGSRVGGPESEENNPEVERTGTCFPESRSGQTDEVQAGRPLRGDDGGHEPTDRAEMQNAQVRKAAGRPAARAGSLPPTQSVLRVWARTGLEGRGQTNRLSS